MSRIVHIIVNNCKHCHRLSNFSKIIKIVKKKERVNLNMNLPSTSEYPAGEEMLLFSSQYIYISNLNNRSIDSM